MKNNFMRKAAIWLAVASGVALPSVGLAADAALVDVIGYSENGRYFAFEEFGIQDGSGFAYSNIYVIDLKIDRWVVGTPIRRRSEDENEQLKDIRAAAQQDIAPLVANFGLYRPAHRVAGNGDGVPGETGKALKFGVPAYFSEPSVVGEYDILLDIGEVPSGAPCQDWFSAEGMGYVLSITDHGAAREVHRDTTLPRSRGCPVDYRIADVYLPYGASDISSAVVLISVYTFGFEGRDRRFIAQPLAATAGNF